VAPFPSLCGEWFVTACVGFSFFFLLFCFFSIVQSCMASCHIHRPLPRTAALSCCFDVLPTHAQSKTYLKQERKRDVYQLVHCNIVLLTHAATLCARCALYTVRCTLCAVLCALHYAHPRCIHCAPRYALHDAAGFLHCAANSGLLLCAATRVCLHLCASPYTLLCMCIFLL